MMNKFKRNERGKDYVVGDLHGCYDMLMNQLSSINFNFTYDRVFCCGDLIDRGDKSLECLLLMYEPWFFSVRGNHEQMMIDVCHHGVDDGGLWYMNGGVWSLSEDSSFIKDLAEELDYLLPYQIEINEEVGIVHADVGNSWRLLSKDMKVSALWDRTRISGRGKYTRVEGIKRLYVGHTPTKQKLVIDNVHYMDSGAVFTGQPLRIEEIVYD